MKIKAIALRSVTAVACLTVIVGLGTAPAQASYAIAQCRTTNLSLGFGDHVSPMTGEQGVIYTLTNHEKISCQL